MGCTIKTSFCSRVTFSRRSPVAMSNGCAPVLASYSAITLFTSSMSAVAGSYSRSAVSPWDEKVRILAFMLGLLRDVHLRSFVEQQSAGGALQLIYGTVSQSCQETTDHGYSGGTFRISRHEKNQTGVMLAARHAAQLFLDVVA